MTKLKATIAYSSSIKPKLINAMFYIIVGHQNTGLRNLEPEGPELWHPSKARALLRPEGYKLRNPLCFEV